MNSMRLATCSAALVRAFVARFSLLRNTTHSEGCFDSSSRQKLNTKIKELGEKDIRDDEISEDPQEEDSTTNTAVFHSMLMKTAQQAKKTIWRKLMKNAGMQHHK